MNAVTAVSTTQEAASRGSLVQEIPLANISESKTNPRSQYDEAKLAELAANVKQAHEVTFNASFLDVTAYAFERSSFQRVGKVISASHRNMELNQIIAELIRIEFH